jgi:hypothetical protein
VRHSQGLDSVCKKVGELMAGFQRWPPLPDVKAGFGPNVFNRNNVFPIFCAIHNRAHLMFLQQGMSKCPLWEYICSHLN